jgi:hypothetical protein
MEPLCDLVLQHPSISRTHAGFQFDEYGMYIRIDRKVAVIEVVLL